MNLDKIKLQTGPVIEALGYEVVDIELTKKLGQVHLSFYIANEGSITFDDCQKVHEALDLILEELNPSGDSPYVLNVSSPGLDRPFKTDRDFERNLNKKVEIKLFAPLKGKKIYEGVLLEKGQHVLIIETLDKKEKLQLELAKIVYVRPYVSFEGIE